MFGVANVSDFVVHTLQKGGAGIIVLIRRFGIVDEYYFA